LRRGARPEALVPKIEISIPDQMLTLRSDEGKALKRYLVSTSRNGAGEREGSFCTPRGEHIVRAKIGAGQPLNTVFVRRRPTGEIWTPELAERFPGRDWILTRILWLSGCEPGKNRLNEVDTMRRYIYIHGSPDSVAVGKPGSIGCIRMRNQDIVDLFELVPPGTGVSIAEQREAAAIE
jgi:lipoprotein-anchoring transpeptidase ErfK/SrfK